MCACVCVCMCVKCVVEKVRESYVPSSPEWIVTRGCGGAIMESALSFAVATTVVHICAQNTPQW